MMELPERFSLLVKKIYYIHERYQVEATFTMLHVQHPIEMDEVSEMIRRSDEIFQIDPHRFFVAFTFTDQESARQACVNLLKKLDRHFNDHSSSIALDNFDPSKSPQIVVSRLNQILDEIEKRPYIRIENESILDTWM